MLREQETTKRQDSFFRAPNHERTLGNYLRQQCSANIAAKRGVQRSIDTINTAIRDLENQRTVLAAILDMLDANTLTTENQYSQIFAEGVQEQEDIDH